MNEKKFGALSSSVNPNELSLAYTSLVQFVLWVAAMYAVTHGLDQMQVTTQVQGILDQGATIVTAGFSIYHAVQTIWGFARKLMVYLATTKNTGPIAVAQNPS